MIEQTVRTLTELEKQALRLSMTTCRNRLKRVPARLLLSSIAINSVLCSATLLASDAPRLVVIFTWLAIALLLVGWGDFDERRDIVQSIRRLESALNTNEARVTRISSDLAVELQEIEDEGACYAFQIGPERIVFVTGQEFYSSARFPNTDFALSSILDETGRAVEMLIEKRGQRLKPMRLISSEVKARLRQPNHLEIVEGHLDDLEKCLAN